MCMSRTSLVFWRRLVCWGAASHQGISLFNQRSLQFLSWESRPANRWTCQFSYRAFRTFLLWKTTQTCQKGPSHWQKPGKAKPVGDWNKTFYYILRKSKLARLFWPKEKPLVILGLFKFIKCWRHSQICKGQWIHSVGRSRVTPAKRDSLQKVWLDFLGSLVLWPSWHPITFFPKTLPRGNRFKK